MAATSPSTPLTCSSPPSAMDHEITRIGKTEVDTLFRRLLAFVQRCRDGLRQQIDESNDVYDMCVGVEKKLPEASRIRLFLLTNSLASVSDPPDDARRPPRQLTRSGTLPDSTG